MAESDFAIVCDATSDLPASFLEKARVACVPLDKPDAGAGMRPAIERTYRALIEQGFSQVISVHSGARFSPILEEARAAAGAVSSALNADVRVIDSGAASVATGMLVDRAALCRYLGRTIDEAAAALEALAKRVRLLVIPAAPVRLSAPGRPRGGLVGRAAASLRMRMTGERNLYLLAGDEVTQLARHNDRTALVDRLARAAATVSANEGPLVHAVAEAGDQRMAHMADLALEGIGVTTRSLGTVRASGLTETVVGTGAVAVALAPEAAYTRCGAELLEAAPEGVFALHGPQGLG